MTDRRPRRRPSPPAQEAPHVWVCTFEHRDGIDVWACAAEALAYRELANVCREFWEEARAVDRSLIPCEDEEPIPATPPDDDRAAVEAYFAAMNHDDPPESFLIAAHEVIGAEGGGPR
jgi:hypothetical protein